MFLSLSLVWVFFIIIYYLWVLYFKTLFQTALFRGLFYMVFWQI